MELGMATSQAHQPIRERREGGGKRIGFNSQNEQTKFQTPVKTHRKEKKTSLPYEDVIHQYFGCVGDNAFYTHLLNPLIIHFVILVFLPLISSYFFVQFYSASRMGILK